MLDLERRNPGVANSAEKYRIHNMNLITTPGLEACPRCATPIERGQTVCPRCGLRFDTLSATADGAAGGATADDTPPELAHGSTEEDASYTGVEHQDERSSTEPLAPELVEAEGSVEAAEEATDADDAAFITGESVPRSATEPETGALAGRSARASEDAIFATLPDTSYDVPTFSGASAVPDVPYDVYDTYNAYGAEDAFVAHEAVGTSDAPANPNVPGVADVPHDAALDVDPGPAPDVVLDVASDIARDAEGEPEIVGAPVAMSIPTTPITTVAVEDRQRSRNQLLAAGVAALAVLVLCLAVIFAAAGARGGNATPTAEAGVSPTVPVVAIVNSATSTAEVASPVPPTATAPVEAGTATTGPIVAPTQPAQRADTAQPIDTALPLPTDTAVVVPTDTVAPVPTDTAVPAPTDTRPPAPTDTAVPPPTNTRPPVPTDTQRPRPTNTRAPASTNTAVRPRPTATRPAPPPPTAAPSRGIGDMVTGFNGWTVMPMWVQTRSQLPSPDPQVFYKPSGVYWLVRIDARNTLSQPRSFGGTMDFVLRDTNGKLYAELSDHGREPGVREVARREGLSYLNTVLNEGEAAATLLIFDIPRGVQPAQLVGRIIEGNGVSRNGQVVWRLQK